MASSKLVPRGAVNDRSLNKPVGYNGAVFRTNQFVQQIAAGNQPQSIFTDYSAIANNYKLFGDARFFGDTSLNDTFAAIGVSDANFQSWGAQYTPPDGTAPLIFNFWVNVHDGILLVDHAESAESGARIPENVPTRLSDIMFLVWMHICDTLVPQAEPRTLRYILGRSLENKSSQAISKMAIRAAGSKISEWPGTQLNPGTDPWRAVIGCPGGIAVAWLLLQHQEVFGSKSLSTAWVFENSAEELCFLYSFAG
ncbi:hypothetical protein MMC10_000957 [Thelotrema lepadinum]|nr:hypothetical protein [Thelotrema lepadinum]